MLKKLLKQKLCPVLSLALVFGCGKKITEKSTESGANSIQTQMPDPLLVIKLVENNSVKKTFTIPRDGHFRIPAKIFVEKGSGVGRKVTISYNKEPGSNTIFEFKCTYKSTTQIDNLPYEKCVGSDGRSELGNLVGREMNLDRDRQIELILQNPTPSAELEIHAWYDVKWL